MTKTLVGLPQKIRKTAFPFTPRLRVVLLFFLRDNKASETRARVKITPREKRRHRVSPFSCGVIFTRARVSLALLSLRKNGGLFVVYITPAVRHPLDNSPDSSSSALILTSSLDTRAGHPFHGWLKLQHVQKSSLVKYCLISSS